jgi:signal transduction histidine kinase
VGLEARENRVTTLATLGARLLLVLLVFLFWAASWGFDLHNTQAPRFFAGFGVALIALAVFAIAAWFWKDPTFFLVVLLGFDLLAVTTLSVLTGGLASPMLAAYVAPIVFSLLYGHRTFANLTACGTAAASVVLVLFDLFGSVTPIIGPAVVLDRAAAFRGPLILVVVLVALLASWSEASRRARAQARIDALERKLGDANEELTRSFYDLESALSRVRAEEQRVYQARQQLLRAERFSAVGKLAAGVLHDLANPLSVIVTDAEMHLLKPEDRSEKVREVFRRILANAQHISLLIDNLRLLTRQRGDSVYAPVDMRHLVMRCLTALEPARRRRGVVLDARLEEGGPKVLGVESQLEQMIVNLLVNAFEAISQPGGRVSVRTRAGAERYCLEIEDDGEGIDRQHLPYIFEPFFTTRASATSLGLGLFSVHTIVQEHDGAVNVRSEPGVSTTFTIELPYQPPRRSGLQTSKPAG